MERMQLITNPHVSFSEEKLYLFRKKFCADKPSALEADVFADARYKLYLNGHLIDAGPSRSNASEMYFNHAENKKYLTDGENVLVAVVLQLKNEFDGEMVYRNLGFIRRTGGMCFALQGKVICREGSMDKVICREGSMDKVICREGSMDIETDDSWETACVNGIEFRGDECYVVGLNETAESEYFKSKHWEKAVCAGVCTGYDSDKEKLTQYGRYTLKPAPTPPQRLDPITLSFGPDGVCDAGELMTAYTRFTFSGRGRVRLIYAECRTFTGDDGRIFKADRADKTGDIVGYYDEVSVDGSSVLYEPFWFRTFRFIRAQITGDVTVEKIDALETGYPLKVTGSFDCESETDKKLWEISVRTLKRCLQETYTDCPYYEQEQYLMDTRMQALFTYQISNDDRPIRRTLRDFCSVQRADGMILARTPDILPQIIAGFPLYYIFILHEHYERFGDIEPVKAYISNVSGVLKYFSAQLSEKGLVKRSGFWDFVDWVKEWGEDEGVPLGENKEELAVYTLMYAAALQKTAELHEALGNNEMAQALRLESKNRISDVKKHCYCAEKGLSADGPSKKYFSTHTQIWAVLCGAAEGDEARTVMRNSFALSVQPTYAYCYDYFRALEKCGLYGERKRMLDSLRKLVSYNCTTIPETPGNPRSDCHGWGGVALYEFAASDLGVRVSEPGKVISICPYIGERSWASGTVALKNGSVSVSWTKEDDEFIIEVHSPKDYTKKVMLPDGSVVLQDSENISLSCFLM